MQGYLGLEQAVLRKLQGFAQAVPLQLGAFEAQVGFVALQAQAVEIGQQPVAVGPPADIAVGDASPPVGLPLLIRCLDPFQLRDTFSDVGDQLLEVAQRLQLLLQRLDVHQVLVEQVAEHEVPDVGEGTEGQALDDFGREGVFELAQAVEEVGAIILQACEDLRPRSGRQGEVFQVPAKAAGIIQPAAITEKPGVIQAGIVHDEVDDIGGVVILVGVDQGAVRKATAVGVGELQRHHPRRVAAQIALPFGAELAAHVAAQRALAAGQRSLVETHVSLPSDQGKL